MEDVYSKKPWIAHYDKNVQPTLTYPDKTFSVMFAEIVKQYPDKTALIYMGRKLSFIEVDVIANRLAHYLQKSGLLPGDVVGLHLPNIPAHYIGMIAVQKAGMVTTGLSPLLTPAELAHQLNDSGTKLIMTLDVLFDKIAEVAEKAAFSTVVVTEIADFMPGIKRVLGKLLKKIPTAAVTLLKGKTVVRLTQAMQETPAVPVMVSRTLDDPIFMMYTGGTTGPSKGAVITQRNYMANRCQVLTWLDIRAEDMALSAFPLFHIAGLALGGFTLTQGTTQICVPNPRDTAFLIHAIKTWKPTFMVNVPTVYFQLMKNPEFVRMNLGPLKWCLSAAAPFPAENIKELEAIIGKGNFIELYGMTETSPVTCCNPRYGIKKPSSIGVPLPDTEFLLVDPETGQPVEIGHPGEILIRGPQVMRGYFNKPEETAHALESGWMHTGDIARMDADGYFYVVDRLKDMVIVSGFKVFTKELDDVISRHPDIQLAASVGVPDPERPGSERVAMAVVLCPGIEKSDGEKEKILAFLKENIAPYKIPKVIRFMDELPTSGVGKILKREIRKMLSDKL
ncbi:MAG: AMP-binding protein [Deltaproteobacteria bacterium]|nr:AMP-binding protein [Deltaproteobacteria bacterium]